MKLWNKSLIGQLLVFIPLFGFCLGGRRGTTVETNSGKVRGGVSISRLQREFYSWKGIPYAEPPVGQLRYADPLPVRSWTNRTYNGLKYGPFCVQGVGVGPVPIGSEDCLTLNIFTPCDAYERGVPMAVMIFFHGGEFEVLAGQSFVPDYFMDEDVVLVTVNYRLNSFGFLSTGDQVVRGNMGLKDQVMAMRWIKDNVEFFGGDRNRITIFGESAGGASVHFHILSPMSRGLFHSAISESGVANAAWAFNDDPRAQTETFARRLNCPTTSSVEMVECLRRKNIVQILKAQQKTVIFGNPEIPLKVDFFLPTAEVVHDANAFLTSTPSTLIQNREFTHVPWMVGVNSEEGLLFTAPFVLNQKLREELNRNWKSTAWTQLMLSPAERAKSDSIRKFYFGNQSLNTTDIVPDYITLMTDRHYHVPFYQAVNVHGAEASTYAYYYSKRGASLYNILLKVPERYPRVLGFFRGFIQNWIDEHIHQLPPGKFGVGHADELLMLAPFFSIFYVGKHHPDFQYSRDMVRLWVDFASNHKNLSFRGLNFTSFQHGEDPYFFNLDRHPKLVKLGLKKRVDFWDTLET